jgi:hypothetical protein
MATNRAAAALVSDRDDLVRWRCASTSAHPLTEARMNLALVRADGSGHRSVNAGPSFGRRENGLDTRMAAESSAEGTPEPAALWPLILAGLGVLNRRFLDATRPGLTPLA